MVGGARGAHRVQAALRGLYLLCALDPTLIAQVAATWEQLPPDRRYFVLLVAERLVAEQPVAAATLESLVDQSFAGDNTRHALQAAIVRIARARASGAERPDIRFESSGDHDHTVPPASPGLLAVNPQMYGALGLTQGPSAARQSSLQLAAAFDLDPDALERDVADHLRGIALPPRRGRRSQQNALDGEMLLTNSAALDGVAGWAINEYAAGCLGDGTPELLAQALLEMDDPWVLTYAAASAADAATWPIDDVLDRLLAGDRAGAIGQLMQHVSAGLQEGERVAGAVLQTYSRTSDVVLHVGARWGNDDGRSMPTTFNGRTFVYYADDAFEPHQDRRRGWLTFRAGGQGLISHALAPLVPARLWRSCGWTPSLTNPFDWCSVDGPVARFELRYGPIRDSVQDRLYRQPVLSRWVVSSGAWRVLEERLGTSLHVVPDLATYAVPS